MGHLERLAAGEPMYVAPTLDWVPFSYPPLYYLFAWPVAKLTGVSFYPLRIVSTVASLGNCGLIAWLVAAETGCGAAGVAAAGLFAATYRIGGAWFDVARVDALFVLFSLAAIALMRRGRGWGSAFWAGVALFCAAWTKQTALGLVPALCLAGLDRPARGVILGLTVTTALAAAVGWMHQATNGWFTYYAWLLPRKHYEYGCAPEFWKLDVWNPLPVACVLAGLAVLGLLAKRRWSGVAYALISGALLVCAWISRAHCGGYENVLMPGYLALALLSGLTLGHAPKLPRVGWLVGIGVWGALCWQLWHLRYDIVAQVPTERDRAAGDDLVLRISETPGSVWVFSHSRYAASAGKPRLVHWMAMCDVLRDPDPGPREKLGEQLFAAITWKRFGAIVTDDDYFPGPIHEHYEKIGPVFTAPQVLYPVTGFRTRPTWIWKPKVSL